MTVEAWQRLLAAEVSPAKSRALLEGSGSFFDPATSPLLTDREKDKAAAADLDALQRALAAGARLLGPEDYSEGLACLDFAPPALFAHGDAECLHRPTVAIVGTRDVSTYGRACAFKFAQAFARAGVTVVSGGALGIDASAHKGALESGGKTVAVLAGGVDHVYPSVHGGLFRQIRESGCLVSQFAVGSKPTEYKFLMRNALVAMLSLAVVVIEAPPRSGALRTARDANEIGREVFVVPGDVTRLSFRGSFNLIRDGATLVDNPDQVLEALDLEPALPLDVRPPASTTAQQVLAVLSTTPTPTEKIVEQTKIDAADVLSELTMLELEGRVTREPGGYAVRL
ncbi:MAG TPA: DNA-processing protein DprA [Fimbriimonas sp.]